MAKWFVVFLLLLRFAYVFRLEVNSDEPQNLHVVYGWAEGKVPYLDRFDNHTPLLHLVSIPLARAAGESLDIVLWARLAVLPIGLAALALAFLLARKLFGSRTAMWSTALLLAFPDWSLKSLEYRPDILWAALIFGAMWLIADAIAQAPPGQATRPVSVWRFFVAGILIGAALMTSVKTLVFGLALTVSVLLAWGLAAGLRERFPIRRVFLCGAAGLTGSVLVPALMIGWFASQGALSSMLTCVYTINREPISWSLAWLFCLGFAVAVGLAVRLIQRSHAQGGIQSALFLTTAIYALFIVAFTQKEAAAKQTFLIAYPMLIATGWHLLAGWKVLRRNPRALPTIGATGCLVGLVVTLVAHPIQDDGLRAQRELLSDVIRFTRPEETVFDVKGETVFRERPVFLAYVGIINRAIREGRWTAETPQPSDLFSQNTAFAAARLTGLPRDMREAVGDYYTPAEGARMRAAGALLKPEYEEGRWVQTVEIPLPGEYVIVRKGAVESTLTVPTAGPHRFDFGTDRTRRTLFWKAAWDRGMRPSEPTGSK